VTATKARRTDRTAGTREAIMSAAERLYAERGLADVSSRQIAEAAGQGNVTAVSYHFGDRTGLIRAIMTRHGERADLIRARHAAAVEGSTEIRDWVGCLVRPVTEHLAELGTPSWHARFTAQVMTDPRLRAIVSEEAVARPHLRRILDALATCLPDLPVPVRAARGEMARHLINHTCAERERALAEHPTAPHPTWPETANALTDALVGLLTAPNTVAP